MQKSNITLNFNMVNFVTRISTILLLPGIILSSCGKDEEEYAYFGKWESDIHDAISLDSIVVKEQRFIEFTNNRFEDMVYQGAEPGTLDLAYSIKGSISSEVLGNLDAVILEISFEGDSYINKNTNRDMFEELFESRMSGLLYERYTIGSAINGNQMLMTIPLRNFDGGPDYIHSFYLYRIE